MNLPVSDTLHTSGIEPFGAATRPDLTVFSSSLRGVVLHPLTSLGEAPLQVHEWLKPSASFLPLGLGLLAECPILLKLLLRPAWWDGAVHMTRHVKPQRQACIKRRG